MSERNLTIRTDSGTAPATLFSDGGERCAVLLFMDAFGPRPALFDMARRIHALGPAVLVPDLFYRSRPYGPFDPRTVFSSEASKAQLNAMLSGLSQSMTRADTAAFLAALEAEDLRGPVAVVGYCMGGGRAITSAAAYPKRIVLAASFHGGRLATDAEDSPHAVAASIRGRVYVGSAGIDGSFPPAQSARLAEALRSAEVDHIIENYPGMAHGWTVPDSPAYDPPGAERHWARLGMLFAEAFGEAAAKSA